MLGICWLDKKPGPCRMTVPNNRFYYDKHMKKCLPFEYGGEFYLKVLNFKLIK